MLRTRLDCFSGAEARADAAASMEIGEAKPIRSSEVGSAATPHCLYEVFSTPYTDEEVARGERISLFNQQFPVVFKPFVAFVSMVAQGFRSS